MKNTFIVAIPVGYADARKVCESIENTTFKDLNELRNILGKASY